MKIAFLAFVLFASLGFATPIKYVAVFETQADREGVLDEADLRYLTNELRKLALEQLPKANYSVMTRDNILSLLPPDRDAAECFEGMCLVEIGRNVGADYAVQGTVSKFDGKLTLTVEAYETLSGKLVGSFTSESPTATELLGAMREKSPEMFAGIKSIDPQIQSAENKKTGLAWSTWTAIGLDALGVAAIAFGVYQNSNSNSLYNDYKNLGDGTPQPEMRSAWKKVESAETKRNVGYIVGGVLLAGGITFHFAF
jgi:hypothetical protein